MKVLCLHGRGTSGSIFQIQLSSIRSRLSDLDLEFDFVDGQYPCTPAPGIDLFFPPPYYSYLRDDSPESLSEVISHLNHIVASQGPYDLVLSFSQGTAMAAALLLHHAANNNNGPSKVPAPFKSAVFICGGAPLSFLEDIGYRISPQALRRDRLSRVTLSRMADSSAILAKGNARWTGLDVPGDRLREDEVRKEIVGEVKIGIPTAHIYGTRDPRYVAGIQLSEACDSSKRKVYNHGGGHEIPRYEAVTSTISDLIRWALRAGESS